MAAQKAGRLAWNGIDDGDDVGVRCRRFDRFHRKAYRWCPVLGQLLGLYRYEVTIYHRSAFVQRGRDVVC